MPPTLVPLVQLAVSAARADGELSDDEVAVIRTRAGELGAAALVDSELQQRRPLDTITPAFTTPEQRQMAYALAYAVVHGEDAVSVGERMYLTQLQRLLRLDHADVERIERETLAGGDEQLTTDGRLATDAHGRAGERRTSPAATLAEPIPDLPIPDPDPDSRCPVPGTRYPVPDRGDTHVVLRPEQRSRRPDHLR